jgi:hypothetical protein
MKELLGMPLLTINNQFALRTSVNLAPGQQEKQHTEQEIEANKSDQCEDRRFLIHGRQCSIGREAAHRGSSVELLRDGDKADTSPAFHEKTGFALFPR